MNKKWTDIDWARKTLQLPERSTLAAIKRAFRKLSKKNHPDLLGDRLATTSMHDLNQAYKILLEYCNTYEFPLSKGIEEEVDDEEWWMDRFGTDQLWGKNPGGT